MAKVTVVDGGDAIDLGVVANSRLTASVGAILLVTLAIEGFTLFDVNGMFALHAFVGMLLIPVAMLKLCSTGYRFWKYYTGDPAYRRRGPPHIILRVTAPLVVISTVALLGTGAALLAVAPDNADALVTVHQASFIVWFSVTTIHVLGHIVETWRLTGDDLRATSTPAVPGVGMRRGLVLLSLVIGVGLGVASLGWNHDWTNRGHFKRDGDGRGAAPAHPADTVLGASSMSAHRAAIEPRS